MSSLTSVDFGNRPPGNEIEGQSQGDHRKHGGAADGHPIILTMFFLWHWPWISSQGSLLPQTNDVRLLMRSPGPEKTNMAFYQTCAFNINTKHIINLVIVWRNYIRNVNV